MMQRGRALQVEWPAPRIRTAASNSLPIGDPGACPFAALLAVRAIRGVACMEHRLPAVCHDCGRLVPFCTSFIGWPMQMLDCLTPLPVSDAPLQLC